MSIPLESVADLQVSDGLEHSKAVALRVELRQRVAGLTHLQLEMSEHREHKPERREGGKSDMTHKPDLQRKNNDITPPITTSGILHNKVIPLEN